MSLLFVHFHAMARAVVGLTGLLLVPFMIRAETPDGIEREAPGGTLTVYFENDLFFDQDRYYTNGAKISWISSDFSEAFARASEVPGWARPLVRRLPFVNKREVEKNIVFSLGQNLFTPQDISVAEAQPGDRPYAAWLYLGMGLHAKTERWQNVMELNVGVVGPWALGEETQNSVHRSRGIPTAQGWDHQIRNEVVVNVIFERRRRVELYGERGGFAVDAIGHLGGSLGTLYTYLNTGGTVRVGWNLPHDFGASVIRLAGDTNAPVREERAWRTDHPFGFHLFFGFDGRLVARDLTLDGNTFRDSARIEREWWVGDASGGFALSWGRWKASYAATFRSRTFRGGGMQTFGSINLSANF